MNTTKKLVIAVVALALALISFASVSLAWLVSKPDPVINTFTVGNIEITIDEADVDDSDKDNDITDRDKANSYKLVPGQTYDKDPTVHVTSATTEKCYIFVKIENNLKTLGLEVASGEKTIDAQIEALGWNAVNGHADVYYQVYDPAVATKDFKVFETFTIGGENVTKTTLAQVKSSTIVSITAYAIQYASFESDVTSAWTTVYAAANN